MQKKYEAPELMLIGEANDVVMGTSFGGIDLPYNTATDFEFEED